MPWLAVHGNHDLGDKDRFACCPDVAPNIKVSGQNYAGLQLNRDKNPFRPAGTERYWLPDYNYHYNIPEADLELIAVDRNYCDMDGLGGDVGGHTESMKSCGKGDQKAGLLKMTSFLNSVAAGSDNLLRARAANGTAKSVIIIQHYPHEKAVVRKIFQGALGTRKPQVVQAYGHTHNQDCDVTGPGGCADVMTGGGGGCCHPEVNLAGFTAVNLDDHGGMTVDVTSPDVRLKAGECPYGPFDEHDFK